VVIGFVLADEPFQYSDKSSSGGKNKISAEQRAKRGFLPAQSNILRATVPVTEFTEASHKYYVLCGMCSMRLITSDAIFFFEEIWSQATSYANLKDHQPALGQACRAAAPKTKPLTPGALTSIEKGDGT
jgi:hypothetical protein